MSDRRLRLRAGAVEWREIEGQVIAIDTRSSVYLAVNPSGAPLWQALAEGTDRERLVEKLMAEHQIDIDQATSDVEVFLEMLTEQDLLEP